MAIPPIRGTQAVPSPGRQPDKPAEAFGISARQDPQLLSSSAPLLLLYRSAIESINEHLAPELGPEAIQQAAQSGMDFSPEAVAERIVSFATGFFASYRLHRPNETAGGLLEDFMSTIREAIDQGFAEARKILSGLDVLEGEIAAGVDRTYELIQEGLDRFEADNLNSAEA